MLAYFQIRCRNRLERLINAWKVSCESTSSDDVPEHNFSDCVLFVFTLRPGALLLYS